MNSEKISSCPICGTTILQDFITAKDYTCSGESFKIENCSNCTLGITNPRPVQAEISKYYQSQNYISHTGGTSNLVDTLYRSARNYTQRWKKKIIEKHQTTTGTILDFGCGTGEFLTYLKSQGWQTTGIEPTETARKKALQNLEENVYMNLTEVDAKQFDIITLWHVAEHLHDLNETMLRLKSNLKKGGTIFIAVPNYESADAKRYGSHWAAYDVPRHLWHFSQKAMNLLLEKSGFAIQEIVPMKLDALYISYLSESYKHPNIPKPLNLLTGCWHGLRSNQAAKKTKNFSSLIYIAKA